MTNEPKLAAETPAKDAADQSIKPADAKPAAAPVAATAPPVDAKKT
jgi:hypothetical protein